MADNTIQNHEKAISLNGELLDSVNSDDFRSSKRS